MLFQPAGCTNPMVLVTGFAGIGMKGRDALRERACRNTVPALIRELNRAPKRRCCMRKTAGEKVDMIKVDIID